MTSKTTKKFAIGTIIAAIVGYVAGLLTAPKSGKETRKDIKETAGKAAAEAEADLNKLHNELDGLITKAKGQSDKLEGRAKEQFGIALETATTAKDKAREVLAAVQTGKTEDKDLKKALDEATKALNNLKSYLKKS